MKDFTPAQTSIRRKRTEAEVRKLSEDHQLNRSLMSNGAIAGEFLRQLISYLEGAKSKVEVINQIESVATPDVDKVVAAIEALESSLGSNQPDFAPVTGSLEALVARIDALPDSQPATEAPDAISINNLDELKARFDDVVSAVRAIKVEPRVDAPNVDLKPLQAAMTTVVKAIQAQTFPEPVATDVSGLEDRLDESNKQLTDANKHLKKLVDKPISGGGGGGGGGAAFINSSGNMAYPQLTVAGAVPVDIGAATVVISGPVTISNEVEVKNDSGNPVPVSASTLPLPTGAATESTLGNVLTTSAFQARVNTLGQKTKANSMPVTLASDQDALPVTGTFWQGTQPVSLASVPSHAVTNAGTFAVQNTAALPAGTNNIGDVDVLTVNGVAPAFGTGTRSASTQRVTIATDDVVLVKETQPSSEATTSLANSVSNQTALVANANRLMATFYNDDTPGTGASVYLKCGATASAASCKIKIAPGGYYELPHPVWPGIIDVIATAATGNLRITETT